MNEGRGRKWVQMVGVQQGAMKAGCQHRAVKNGFASLNKR